MSGVNRNDSRLAQIERRERKKKKKDMKRGSWYERDNLIKESRH